MTNVHFPLAHVRVLSEPDLGVGSLAPKAFWAESRPQEGMAKLRDVTFQRQETHFLTGLEMFSRVMLPRGQTAEPPGAWETEFLKLPDFLGRRFSASIHV